MRVFSFRCAWKKALNLLKKGLLVWGEAMEASKRRRSKLDYIIQQLSKGSSEGSSIILEVPDEPKDNSGSSSSSLFGSNDESIVDVPIHQEDPVVQITPLVDTVISMVFPMVAAAGTSQVRFIAT
ncbi:hypothetical protein Tco_1175043 [Tanacetum coccineum]